MATHSSVLAWRIQGTGEPRGLSSMGLHRVWHDWRDLAAAAVNWGGVGQLWILWLKLQTGQGLKLVLLYPDFIAEEHSLSILLQAASYCRPSPVHLQNPWEACGQPSLCVFSFSPAETRYNTPPSISLSLQNPERIGCGCSLGGSDRGSGVPGRVV